MRAVENLLKMAKDRGLSLRETWKLVKIAFPNREHRAIACNCLRIGREEKQILLGN